MLVKPTRRKKKTVEAEKNLFFLFLLGIFQDFCQRRCSKNVHILIKVVFWNIFQENAHDVVAISRLTANHRHTSAVCMTLPLMTVASKSRRPVISVTTTCVIPQVGKRY